MDAIVAKAQWKRIGCWHRNLSLSRLNGRHLGRGEGDVLSPVHTAFQQFEKKNHRGYLSINRSDLFLLNILRFMFLLRFKREKKNIVDDFGPGAFLEQNILKSGHRSPFCCDWSDGPLKRSGRSRGHVPPSLETCAKKKNLFELESMTK